jgi:serine/threonine protein kinase
MTFAGTPQYMAPEMFARQGHGLAVDWWGLGMLTYEMLTGLPPWYDRDASIVEQSICTSALIFPRYLNRVAAHFILSLLTRDVYSRLGSRGAQEVKNHPFLNNPKWSWSAIAERHVLPPFNPCLDCTDEEEAINFHNEYKTMPIEEITKHWHQAPPPVAATQPDGTQTECDQFVEDTTTQQSNGNDSMSNPIDELEELVYFSCEEERERVALIESLVLNRVTTDTIW